MYNTKRSQEKNIGGWQEFLDEAKKRFADAKDKKERAEWRRSINGFQRLIRQRVQMPDAKAIA